ncbi:hypothetical protein [Parabacteroides chinchillae]|uniref:Uncharacterized protein n=1 Tax=Parabacteroides chinchillae TaxID=871327 RepID=A0A8G2BWD2_9BACT|nr:hypothetical protein [Parabacteroides chinchillae]SEF85998.1 hypothetical protein SAMN05444001_108101 [Parabacteroides chinchillae]
MIYINKTIPFWETEKVLPLSYKTGVSIEDYENGAFLLLSDEQSAFHVAHPDATPLEVWKMELTPAPDPAPEPDPLKTARQAKLQEIVAQDEFSNKFFVSVLSGGTEIANVELWIDKDLRNSLYSITLPALQADGQTTTKLWTTGTPPQSIDVPIVWALDKLPLLEIYAKRTYDLKASNEAAAYAATTVEEIAQIDVKANYPYFLTFELNLDLNTQDNANNTTETNS